LSGPPNLSRNYDRCSIVGAIHELPLQRRRDLPVTLTCQGWTIDCLFVGTTSVPLRPFGIRIRRDLLVRSAYQRSIIHSPSMGTTSVPLRSSTNAVAGVPPMPTRPTPVLSGIRSCPVFPEPPVPGRLESSGHHFRVRLADQSGEPFLHLLWPRTGTLSWCLLRCSLQLKVETEPEKRRRSSCSADGWRSRATS